MPAGYEYVPDGTYDEMVAILKEARRWIAANTPMKTVYSGDEPGNLLVRINALLENLEENED